jgi:hypothetical protein
MPPTLVGDEVLKEFAVGWIWRATHPREFKRPGLRAPKSDANVSISGEAGRYCRITMRVSIGVELERGEVRI